MYIDVHIFAGGVEVHQKPDTSSHVQRKRARVSTIREVVRDGRTNDCASTATEPVGLQGKSTGALLLILFNSHIFAARRDAAMLARSWES